MKGDTVRSDNGGSEGDAVAISPVDRRRPYEAPRVLIKRSVAHATLLTNSQGPTGSMLLASG